MNPFHEKFGVGSVRMKFATTESEEIMSGIDT
jgi:hypothetical protein